MADNDRSGKDFNPKHRVIGAIVLVSLAVIFVPMILDERTPPPSPAVAQLSDIPSPETKILVADLTPATTTTETSSTVAPSTATTTQTPAKIDTKALAPAVATESKESVMREPTAVKPAVQSAAHTDEQAPASKGWFVQVGTFSNGENAKQLADRLKAHGFPVHLEKVALADGKAVRVRVGPYHASAQAKQAQADLKRKAGVSGLLHAD